MNQVGIDFGTSFSSISVLEDGHPRSLKIATGYGNYCDSFSLPSSVYLDEDNNIFIGQVADNLKHKDPLRYKREFKKNIGQLVPIKLGGREFMPQELCEIVFKYFYEKVIEVTGSKIDRVVITYPAQFSPYKQNLIAEVAKNAGFKDVVLIDEPTAAAIYYFGNGKVKVGEKLLVYDLGGGTFDLALIERSSNGYRQLTPPLGIDACGGIVFNKIIFDDIKTFLKQTKNLDIDLVDLSLDSSSPIRKLVSQIEEESILLKCQLSTQQSVTLGLTLPTYEYVEYTLERTRFEEMIFKYIKATCDQIKEVVGNANLKINDLDKVLFVGGSCRIPMVERMVKEVTSCPIFRDADPELVVSMGASIVSGGNTPLNIQDSSFSGADQNRNNAEKDSKHLDNGLKSYEIFNIHKKMVLSLTDEVIKTITPIEELTVSLEKLEKAKRRLIDDVFKVMVLGQFKVGKSTFINSLIGEEVLPSDIVPCTAVINEIKWSETKKVVIHFKKDIPITLSPYLSSEIVEYIKFYNYSDVPPLEVAVENFKKYVVIPEPDKTQSNSVANHMPYERIEIFWPLELCKNGVVLIDSPGLNDNETMDNITTSYIDKVDASLFVMGCPQIGADSEMKFIDNYLTPVGHDNIFFVCNRFDIVRKIDRAKLIENSIARLNHKTKFEKSGVFFLSATNALDGKLEGDEELIAKSGLLDLEDALGDFLTNDRGIHKLRSALNTLSDSIEESRSLIPKRLSEMHQSVEEIKSRHKKALTQISEIDVSSQEIMNYIKLKKNGILLSIEDSIEAKFKQIIANIPNMCMEIRTSSKLMLILGIDNAQIEKYVNELQNKLRDRIQAEIAKCITFTVRPMIDEFLIYVNEQMSAALSKLQKDLNNVLSDFSAVDAVITSEQFGFNLDGEIDGKGQCGLSDIKFDNNSKGLVITIFTALLSPLSIVAVPTSIITSAIGKLTGNHKGDETLTLVSNKLSLLEELVRKQVSTSFIESFKTSSITRSTSISRDIELKLNAILHTASQMLYDDILKVRKHIDTAVSDCASGSEALNKKRTYLISIQQSLEEFHKNFDTVVAEVIPKNNKYN